MKLYYAPGACSLGIHVLLEEIGAPYEAEAIDLRGRQQFTPAFRAVNPKGKVPALLRDDGSLLTEFPAIAFWLARSFPGAGLIPDDIEGQARVLEVTDFVVSTLHMRGLTLFMMPQKFVAGPAAQAEIRAHGQAVAEAALATLAERLGEAEWMQGDFSIADAALYYALRWSVRDGIAVPPTLLALRDRMEARPATRRALAAEGLA